MTVRKKSPAKPSPEARRQNSLAAKIRDEREARRAQLDALLTCRTLPRGPVYEARGAQLAKQGEGLFKLEGAEFNILLVTGPFMARGAKTIGLLEIDEAELSRLIRHKAGNFADFWRAADRRRLGEEAREIGAALAVGSAPAPAPLEPVLGLLPGRAGAFLAALSPNTLAHAIIRLPETFTDWTIDHCSTRKQKILLEELQFLRNFTQTDGATFHAVRPLAAGEAALREFWDCARKFTG